VPTRRLRRQRPSRWPAYFIGNDPSNWHTHVPRYGQGISIRALIWCTTANSKYEFRVNPGASPDAIRMALKGAIKPE